MVDPRFTESDFWQQMIRYTLIQDEYSKHPFEMHGKYYGRYLRTNIIAPLAMKQYTGDHTELSCFGPAMYYWAYQNAEFMRWTVVDESIPLKDNKRIFGLFDGCRRTNVMALCYLKYWPALPELREAMLHERDSYMRLLCVETIGVTGKYGLPFAEDIRCSIKKFHNDPCYLGYAVKALSQLGDINSAPLIRELYEQTRARIDRLTFDEAMEKEISWIYLIDDITLALIKLDPESARDILAMELADPNSHVRHFTTSAFKLSPLKHDAKLIGSSLTTTVASLPKDPRWIFRRHNNL